MWSTLTLVVLASTAPTPPDGIAFGSRVRLSAGPRVEVPSLVSAVERAQGRRSYREAHGLLVFEGEDGAPAAVIAPGARIEGTLVGADPAWIRVQRSKKGPPDRIDRASVARVELLVHRGHATRNGALIGAGVGAALLSGYYYVFSGLDETGTGRTAQGFLVSAAVGGAAGAGVGALLGLLGTNDVWREVPREALPGRPVAAAEGPTEDRAIVFTPAEPGPFRRAIAELSTASMQP
jgi:hypothetical protein